MSKNKKITAPKTYKPSGKPKEHLAYLNEREMAYLRSLGGSGRPGPRGIPSFADDSASSKGVSRGGNGAVGSSGTSTSNRSSGPGGPSGPNSSPSGTHSTTSGGGNIGGGGSNNSGSRNPTGGSLSAPARTAPSSGNSPGSSNSNSGSRPTSSSLSAPNRTTPSTNRSTVSSAGVVRDSGFADRAGRTDAVAAQSSQIKNAIDAVKNNPAAVSDLRAGGIKTLNVGPMGTPVTVGAGPVYKMTPLNQEKSWIDSAIDSAYNTTVSGLSTAYSGIKSVLGMGTPDYSNLGPVADPRAGIYQNRNTTNVFKTPPVNETVAYKNVINGPVPPRSPIEQAAIDRLKQQYSEYGRAYSTIAPPPALPQQTPSAPNGVYGPRVGINTPVYMRASTIPGMITTGMPSGFSGVDPRYQTIAYQNGMEVVKNDLGQYPSTTGESTFYKNNLGENIIPANGVTVNKNNLGVTPTDEKILEVEDVPPERVNPFARSASAGLPPGYAAEYNIPTGTTINPNPFSNGGIGALRRDVINQASKAVARSADTVPRDAEGNPIGPETPSENTTDSYNPGDAGINPAQVGSDEGPLFPDKTLPQKFAEHLGIAGKILQGADWFTRREWNSMTPQERSNLLAKWERENAAYVREPQTSNGGALREYYANLNQGGNYSPPQQTDTGGGTGGNAGGSNGQRPEIYFMWDVGVNIPSPGDANYNLYIQYLKEKGIV